MNDGQTIVHCSIIRPSSQQNQQRQQQNSKFPFGCHAGFIHILLPKRLILEELAMKVTISHERLKWLIDELLARWRATPKRYPFNRPDAIIPQTLVPNELRRDRKMLANFYVGINCHMKGRIASIQAFRSHIALWQKYPWFYEPRRMLWESPERLMEVLEEFSLIDRDASIRDLRINYRHLETYYDGNALNLTKGVENWDEALRRILNKRTQRALQKAGHGGEGLYGHQHKMVSMTVYWHDWEGWLKPRFPYPSPSDIQNFRWGVGGAAILTDAKPGEAIRGYDVLGIPWREGVLRYIIENKEDSKDVADVLWLGPNLLCGNSPLTQTTKNPNKDGSGMFEEDALPLVQSEQKYLNPKYRKALEETCLICPALSQCKYAVPARPYYDEGKFVFRQRPRMELYFDVRKLTEPTYEARGEPHPFLFDTEPDG